MFSYIDSGFTAKLALIQMWDVLRFVFGHETAQRPSLKGMFGGRCCAGTSNLKSAFCGGGRLSKAGTMCKMELCG